MLRVIGRIAWRSKWFRIAWRWASQLIDPMKLLGGMTGYVRYFNDWRAYSRLEGAEAIRFRDTYPQVHDRTETTRVSGHYFYVNGWAMRRIVGRKPKGHIDIGSQAIFANLLGAVVPVTFVDYRPLEDRLDGLTCLAGDILKLPFPDDSVLSLSCLHVAEHVGLGRYGDPLDPRGTVKATVELTRVLAPGGDLYFAVPVGRPRLCFNAHRIHLAETIRTCFSDLELQEFSGVHDDGRFVEYVSLGEFADSEYALGMFWFRKRDVPAAKLSNV